MVAESLGKNKKGFLPILSKMPKDNHSVMQLYLDGFKNNFFTFFNVHEKNSKKIESKKILSSHKFIKNKNINDIITYFKKKLQRIFFQKKIYHLEVLKLKKEMKKH